MRKYGIEHFYIEEIEQTDNPEEREIYWIEYYQSFKYGYNATLGGDGKRLRNYNLIYTLYQQGKNIKEISEILHYDEKTCFIIDLAIMAFNFFYFPSLKINDINYPKL